jgi:hypothetical protein
MNEVLTKIAVEAQVDHCISHVRLQKFAELIVKECTTVLDDSDGSWYHGEKLNEHFGVEE